MAYSSGPNLSIVGPHCYQSRGNAAVRARGEALTDPGILAQFGAGRWPHYSSYQIGLLAENGNYLETDDIAVRHGVCGDPEQVWHRYSSCVQYILCVCIVYFELSVWLLSLA